jgi:methyltransferase (TIGR00027 family)
VKAQPINHNLSSWKASNETQKDEFILSYNNQTKIVKGQSNYQKEQFSYIDLLKNWEEDKNERFNLDKLNKSFHESVPCLEFFDWKITKVERGFCEAILPINVASSNQYITHQAAIMLLSADYTGGIALATLFHKIPIIGFHATSSDYGVYMWGGKSNIKWYAPSCDDLRCVATIDENKREFLTKRVLTGKKIVTTIDIFMYNGDKLVAKSEFTYWIQDTNSLRKDAFDIEKIDILYDHKTKTTAKLVCGLRALESEKPEKYQRFKDEYASKYAQKHGITLARRFNIITPQLQDMLSIRTWHLDEALKRFSNLHDQINIVNIGSGYDTRALRLNLKNAKFYDLDLPIVLRDRSIFNKKYSNIKTYQIPIDLRNHNLEEIIRKNEDLDLSKPTFFIWEGGTMYFIEEIEKTFDSLSKLMDERSEFWFDYISKDSVDGKTNISDVERFIDNMKKMGEPFINGFNNLDSFAKNFGLSVKTNDSSSKFTENKDSIYNHYKICVLKK